VAEYTALVEAGNALVELLRERMTPEPISNPELIALQSPHASENSQLTIWLFHIEDDQRGVQAGYQQYSRDVQRIGPSNIQLNFLITAHSKAPAQLREADQYRMIGAAIQVIKDEPLLEGRYLSGSLLETNAELHLSLERPNFDQMNKIWNNTASPYKLSIVCKMIGVLIDSKRTRRVSRVSDVSIAVNQKPDAPAGGGYA
jgi:hypothetical protein